jgi:Holliday junction resolvasome RuvABC DNA-binding subunit
MIASVRGEVLDVALDHVVIEAAGVGYGVVATPSTLATLRRGAEARADHRDDRARGFDDALYGFPAEYPRPKHSPVTSTPPHSPPWCDTMAGLI